MYKKPGFGKALLIFFLVLILAGCAQSTAIESPSGTRLILNSHLNYSVRYPAGYDIAIYSDTGLAIVQESLLNIGKPRADINVMPSTTLTMEAVVAELLASYPGAEIEKTEMVIDNEPAIVLNGVPGQAINRIVYVKHQESLFKLNFTPADSQAGDAYKEMEVLYQTVVESLNFEPGP